MATVVPYDPRSKKKEPRRFWFRLDGKRHAIRFPAMTFARAAAIKAHIEELVDCRKSGEPESEPTRLWVDRLGPQLRKSVLEAGLVNPERLGEFLDRYLASRDDVKPNTRAKYLTTRESLVTYFGAERSLREISAEDAAAWRNQLGGKRQLTENTRRKHTAVAKVFFNAAVAQGVLSKSPFGELKATVIPNQERFYFVSREEAERVLEACPDAEWRLIFALARYGGLRCPSEVLQLRWVDVDFDKSRIRVRSPKTEHHAGKESRIVPLFPELRPYLEDAAALNRSAFAVERYRSSNINLRTQLHRIIKRAGLTPWPKTFQNLRSTRQTELAENFPVQAVCAWIGNSKDVALNHYLQVTDDHFQRAAGAISGATDLQSPANPYNSGGDQIAQTAEKPDDCNAVQDSANTLVAEAGLDFGTESREFEGYRCNSVAYLTDEEITERLAEKANEVAELSAELLARQAARTAL